MFHPLFRSVAVSVAVQGGCERGVLIMCPEGDVDRAGAKECVAQLRHLMTGRPSPSVVVIDLGEVRFLGVSGVDILLGWAADAAEHGISIQFLLPARLKRVMMRIGVSGKFVRFAPTRKILGGS